MLIVKNISPRKIYINDLRVLLSPDEIIDIDTNERYIRSNHYSKDLTSLITSGNIQVIQQDPPEESQDISKDELRDILKEVLQDLILEPKKSESSTNSLEKEQKPTMSLNVGEINALIHGRRQKQDDLKNSRISIEDTESDAESAENTSDLVELLRKQKEGAKDV